MLHLNHGMNRSLRQPFSAGEAGRNRCSAHWHARVSLLFLSPVTNLQTPPGSMPLCRPRSDLCRPFWFPNAAARQRASDANVQIVIGISLSVMFIIFESWSSLTVSVSVNTVPAITREPLETCRVIWCRPHLICPQSLHVRTFLIEFACEKFWSRF